jgi:hypothetical protein
MTNQIARQPDGSNQSAYVNQYIQHALTRAEIDPPQLELAGSDAEILVTLYTAHQRGSIEAAQQAWRKILELRPSSTHLPPNQTGKNYRIITVHELKKLPPMEWLIDGMLPRQSTAVLYGAPGAGKSFLGLDLAARVSANHGPVLYLAPEGFNSYSSRVVAWENANKQAVGSVLFCSDAPDLCVEQDVRRFIGVALPWCPALIVIDTLARCIVGADENNAQDMGKVVRACDEMRQALKATILLVHHTGKTGTSERGSNALRAGVDSMIELVNEDGIIRISSSRLKDGKPFGSYKLQMVEHGDSIALIPFDKTSAASETNDPLRERHRTILEMLTLEIFVEAGAKTRRIEEHTGITGGSLDRALSLLKKQAYISQSKKGEPYFITETGRKVING